MYNYLYKIYKYKRGVILEEWEMIWAAIDAEQINAVAAADIQTRKNECNWFLEQKSVLI